MMIYHYFEWLRKIIDQRLGAGNPLDLQEICARNPEPEVKSFKAHPLLDLFRENQLQTHHKVILFLSLAPYYIPACLNTLATDPKLSKFLCLSRSQINGSSIPTVETALFLLSGNQPKERHKYMSCFLTNAPLIKNELIDLPDATQHDPLTTLRLLPGEKSLSTLWSEQSETPQFSGNFPAVKLDTDYQWDDLVLPYDTKEQIEEVHDWVKFEKIMKSNGHDPKFKFGCKSLFHGPPGTGKTMAATLLGKYTGKDVYRVDLSAVVSKYIGETEKNLSRIFDRADHGDWILFFDEADALFGKRGKTNNAHDRYANQEVAYLLQRFEMYEGLSILASNFIDNIDPAFYRRFNTIVHFKKPEYDERLQLWKNYLPEGYSFGPEVDIEEIAYSVEINGGGIYNIMRRSYMKAVLRGDKHILGEDMLESLRIEKSKEGKLLP